MADTAAQIETLHAEQQTRDEASANELQKLNEAHSGCALTHKAIQDKLDTLTQTHIATRQQAAELRDSLTTCQMMIGTLEIENDSLEAQIKKNAQAMEELAEQHKASQSETETKQQELDAENTRLAQELSELNQSQTRAKEYEGEIARFKEQIASLQDNVESAGAASEEAAAATAEKMAEVDELVGKLNECTQQATRYTTQIETLEEQSKACQEQLDGKSQEKERLQNDMDTAVQEHEAKHAVLLDEQSALKARVKELEEELQNQQATLEAKVRGLEAELLDRDNKIKQLEEELGGVEQRQKPSTTVSETMTDEPVVLADASTATSMGAPAGSPMATAERVAELEGLNRELAVLNGQWKEAGRGFIERLGVIRDWMGGAEKGKQQAQEPLV
ncbi:uncharacterized protein BJ171DRAFT_571540 [Polychytrium aggregatum]|uniref:uncharacterized protein n=1 Tax=Polychytrium aggregatum TaxID=110093 RepID=UPI0022FF2535|nr:uncharacterized protein BJ171DRAFT_571540 [Polychytrium aggregatum]KAI9193616.1 hypothetical protein BJ171DRAFT_571540 [Polychytrium aggregatum]